MKPNSRHGCSVEHLTCVLDYRAWRLSWEQCFESAAGIYGDDSPEARDYREANPPPTFKIWLINRRAS